jgi:hypothetical protein
MKRLIASLVFLLCFAGQAALAQSNFLLLGVGFSGSASVPGWDPATVTAVTLTNNNLTATNNSASTSANQGTHVLIASGKTSGKYYFEFTGAGTIHGGNTGVGIGTTASTYTNMGNSATTGNMVFKGGQIYANGSDSGVGIAVLGGGAIHAIAADLDNKRIWFRRVSPTLDNWNNNASANPATNVGGQTISAGTMIPFNTFGGTGGGGGTDSLTANFGASAFTGPIPSGFTVWTP